ncbi:hypothetical protein B5F30_06810 [Lactobacillus johnsonii]|uniref:hypothetical protein n=1 Tax=Lactobacillus johnsonii TaxID=33959 RepID=UPI000B37D298|nr:hypothetical protein [Lactobacillus johnsonii]OUP14883.1 hypothetical protein B5F30_06810 [Lactobacillus johnsonii]
MINDNVYVVEIIEQYNIDDPSSVADFNTYTKLFRDIDKARVYLKLVKQAWLEDEGIDPKDIYEHSDNKSLQTVTSFWLGSIVFMLMFYIVFSY